MAETTLSESQQSKETTLNGSAVSSARFLLSKTNTNLRAHMMSIIFPKRATPEISTVFSLPLSLLTKEQVQNALSTIKKSSSKLSNTNHDVHASKEFVLLLGQFINLSSVLNAAEGHRQLLTTVYKLTGDNVDLADTPFSYPKPLFTALHGIHKTNPYAQAYQPLVDYLEQCDNKQPTEIADWVTQVFSNTIKNQLPVSTSNPAEIKQRLSALRKFLTDNQGNLQKIFDGFQSNPQAYKETIDKLDQLFILAGTTAQIYIDLQLAETLAAYRVNPFRNEQPIASISRRDSEILYGIAQDQRRAAQRSSTPEEFIEASSKFMQCCQQLTTNGETAEQIANALFRDGSVAYFSTTPTILDNIKRICENPTAASFLHVHGIALNRQHSNDIAALQEIRQKYADKYHVSRLTQEAQDHLQKLKSKIREARDIAADKDEGLAYNVRKSDAAIDEQVSQLCTSVQKLNVALPQYAAALSTSPSFRELRSRLRDSGQDCAHLTSDPTVFKAGLLRVEIDLLIKRTALSHTRAAKLAEINNHETMTTNEQLRKKLAEDFSEEKTKSLALIRPRIEHYYKQAYGKSLTNFPDFMEKFSENKTFPKDLQKPGDKDHDALWAFSNMYADLLHDNVKEYYLQVTFPVPALSNDTWESGLFNKLQSLLSSIICLLLPSMRPISDDDEVTDDKVISTLEQELQAAPILQANQAHVLGRG